MQGEGTFAALATGDNAGARRRRQRVYPRLATADARVGVNPPTGPTPPQLGVDELLFGVTGGEALSTGPGAKPGPGAGQLLELRSEEKVQNAPEVTQTGADPGTEVQQMATEAATNDTLGFSQA